MVGNKASQAAMHAGDWHVVLACRDFLKAERMARKAGLSRDDYTVMHLDLSSLESVRQFVDNFRSVQSLSTAGSCGVLQI